jgi:hypothetical protein
MYCARQIEKVANLFLFVKNESLGEVKHKREFSAERMGLYEKVYGEVLE